MLSGSDVVAVEMKQVVDLIVGCEEALGLAGGFELLHLPLSSACRLVRILRSVVQSLVLAMLNAGHDVPLRGAVAGELISDHDAWRSHLLLQQLAQQPLGRLLVASALDVEHDTGLVHRSPQPVLHAGNLGRPRRTIVELPGRTAEMPENAFSTLRAASPKARRRDPKYCADLRHQVGHSEWFSENMI